MTQQFTSPDQNQTLNAPSQMPPQKPKTSWLAIAIVAAVAALVSVGIYYFVSNPSAPICWPYCPGMTDEDRANIKKLATEAETNKTADWKIYSDKINGFEFKYPEKYITSPFVSDTKPPQAIVNDSADKIIDGCFYLGDAANKNELLEKERMGLNDTFFCMTKTAGAGSGMGHVWPDYYYTTARGTKYFSIKFSIEHVNLSCGMYADLPQEKACKEFAQNFHQEVEVPMERIVSTLKFTSADETIIDAERYYVDDLLGQNTSLTPFVKDLIKEITLYDKAGVDAQGKGIATINIAADGADKNTVYFVDDKISGQEVKIYRLNLKNGKFDVIYKLNPDIFNFHLIARQKNKLLFLKIDRMDSPGPCWGNGWVYIYENPWPRPKSVNDSRTIQSLDLNNPAAGLSLFTIPQEKYNREKAKEKTCLQELQAQ